MFWHKLGASGVLVNNIKFASLVFSNFAYYDRQAWYVAGVGDPVAEKNVTARKRAIVIAGNGIWQQVVF